MLNSIILFSIKKIVIILHLIQFFVVAVNELFLHLLFITNLAFVF